MSRGKAVSVGWRIRDWLSDYADRHDLPMAAILAIAVRKFAGVVGHAYDLHDRVTAGRRRRPAGSRLPGRVSQDSVFVSLETYSLLSFHAGRLRVSLAAVAEHVLIEMMRNPPDDADVSDYTRVTTPASTPASSADGDPEPLST